MTCREIRRYTTRPTSHRRMMKMSSRTMYSTDDLRGNESVFMHIFNRIRSHSSAHIRRVDRLVITRSPEARPITQERDVNTFRAERHVVLGGTSRVGKVSEREQPSGGRVCRELPNSPKIDGAGHVTAPVL
ncbi:hypothetical protein EVAR_22874_1 [Eumeta japonica]|uniref:Uncharacterized protein n=1 Tax=Eumeta variegata TaxID=151549 RepID=A0A4C1UU62_EUMVA|nr:hypothetical protein EVAR_22874_1 [Eumeta japonica]